MTQQTNNSFGSWRNRELNRESAAFQPAVKSMAIVHSRYFELRRFIVVCIIGACFAMTLSYFLTREIIARDAELTSQFVANIVSGHGQQVELVKILDGRTDLINLGIGTSTALAVRNQFYDHLNFLPDMQRANVYAADRKIIWSSNPDLIGKIDDANNDLAQVINTSEMVSTDYLSLVNHNVLAQKLTQTPIVNPQQFFVEDYIPLFDENGSVLAVVDVYKEPQSLLATIHRGHLLIWLSTIFTVGFLYFAKFWTNRRMAQMVNAEPQQLQTDTHRSLGETAVITSYDFRKPHKLMRTKAQLGRMRRAG
jgi:two-component system sensor histidine kinase HydH